MASVSIGVDREYLEILTRNAEATNACSACVEFQHIVLVSAVGQET
jgi:hypothetical protein